MLKVIGTVFYFFFFGSIFAQQPAYFILGEDQFRGVQVYNVIQDKEQNYWFATNEGIYKYDFYTYQKIECDKAKSNSMFNFVINDEGTIYCHNLNNQVFQIKENECSLFYELNKEEISADISLAIADDNNLVIGAKKIIVLNKKGTKTASYDIDKKYLGPGYKAKNGQVLFHISSSDFILSYSKGVFLEHKLKFLNNEWQNRGILKFFSIKNLTYAIDLKSKLTFKYDPFSFELTTLPKNIIFERTASVRIYETGNELWIAGSLAGTTIIKDTIALSDTTIYYKDYFISDVYRDNEGNTLLSTFDKGVLVVCDLKIPDVIHSFRDDPITSLYADESLGLVLGSTKGNLMNYANEKFAIINKNGKRPIEGIYGDSKSNLIIFDDGLIRAYDKQTKQILNVAESSLKDAAFISEDQFYLGTNNGIIKCILENNKFKTEWLKDLNVRIYSLEYDPKKQILYAATANGLLSINNFGVIKKINYKSEDVFSKYLYFNKGRLYVTTSKEGVLTIEDNNVTRVILPMVFGNLGTLSKMSIYKNNIIGRSSNGFFQFNMEGKLLESLQPAFGFSSHRVIDFVFQKDQLWVSHSGGVQQLDLSYKQDNLLGFVVRLNEIYVNDQIISLTKKEQFNSDERKIQFTLSAPTLRNRETIHYYYKLVGYDTKWNINNYTSNQIIYNALAPGSYTFIVKLEEQNNFSKPIAYSFSISEPFYNRWWFIICIVSLFVVLVLYIYSWQLNVQRKKSDQINELNASKLIAIQSQMNPHFIFNALNSIQDLVLKGDVEHSYSYITTFSNLVRRTLNYSEKDFIDFDQEIKLLELYLSLEKLRFKKELNYVIDIKSIEDIMLPPLLIQPFIENSLIHGLLHKEGSKNLKITFELKETLICIIEDNGIGREKAKAIKLRQRSEHESFSGKAIHKRFEILSNVFEGNFGYIYEDLYENNEAVGTKVILSMPIKRKF
ncbi:MAG: histidine kinase [Bacteroidetes bacterium]|nr:histidine kinase [Bacteroidota bacterium]